MIADMTVQVPDAAGLVETKVIPDRMQPGSVIWFADDTHYVVLAGEIHYDSESKVENAKAQNLAKIEEFLAAGKMVEPDIRPTAGDYVYYAPSGKVDYVQPGMSREEAEKKAAEQLRAAEPITYWGQSDDDLKREFFMSGGIPDVFAPHIAIYFVEDNKFEIMSGEYTIQVYGTRYKMHI